jgi:diguanylate cyclase (GGDEF)-like protein
VAAKEHLVDAIRSIRERSTGPRSWPIWELPRWLIAFVGIVVLADATVLAFEASTVTVRLHDLALFGGLLFCSAATVELTRRVGENTGFVKDVHATWELPVAMLLPLAYAPVLPIIRFTLNQWRILKAPVYRRAFSASAIGLSYVVAALVFHALIRVAHGAASNPGRHAVVWMLVVAVCAVVQLGINQALVWTAIKGADPSVRIRDEQFAKEPIYNDLSELCVAVLVTFCLATSWIALVFAFPFITLLQRSLRHTRLLKDSRADSKTGLLNAAAWEELSAAEVARAVRTRTSLAVVLLDIDRFKTINDMYGHLVGDQVLREIARTLTSELRNYDRAGRFGGEEFSVLLPQTRAVDAFRAAERIRSKIAALRVIAPGAADGEPVQVTVSIGVAALDAGTDRKLAELMAAADAALYRAKRCGRDQVQMISTTRGLSAVTSAPWSLDDLPAADGDAHDALYAANGDAHDALSAANDDTHEDQSPDEWSAFRRAVTSGPVR